jgi:hypothetical protein
MTSFSRGGISGIFGHVHRPALPLLEGVDEGWLMWVETVPPSIQSKEGELQAGDHDPFMAAREENVQEGWRRGTLYRNRSVG